MLIYSGLGSETKGYKIELDNYYNETNFADIWLYGRNFTGEDQNKVEKISGIDKASRRLLVEGMVEVEKNPNMTLYFQDTYSINRLHVTSGKDFDVLDNKGIWVDYEFAKARDLNVGDELTVSYKNIKLNQIIRGI